MRMIGKLDPNRKHRWPDHISSICHAYNTTRSQVTGYSPHFLMFGCRLHLPIDLLFPTAQRAAIKGVDSYVTALYDHLCLAIGKAKATAEKEARRFKRIYDRRAGAITLHPGDKVLIRLDSFVGQRRKLKNRWDSQIHMVVRHVVDGVPTYVVRNDRSSGEQVLHRARLLLCIADCTNRDDGVSVNLAIAAPMIIGSAEEGTNVNGDKGKSQVLSYGLSLAMFKTSLSPPRHMMGVEAQVVPVGLSQEGVGHVTAADKGDIPPMDKEPTPVEDVPP